MMAQWRQSSITSLCAAAAAAGPVEAAVTAAGTRPAAVQSMGLAGLPHAAADVRCPVCDGRMLPAA